MLDAELIAAYAYDLSWAKGQLVEANYNLQQLRVASTEAVAELDLSEVTFWSTVRDNQLALLLAAQELVAKRAA